MNTKNQTLLKWPVRLVTLLVPPLLLVTSILMLWNPVALNLEYRRPGFPADTFGFSTEDRVKYAWESAVFLVNTQPIEYFDNLHLPDGKNLYNERELSHMVDVKIVVQGTLRGYLAGLLAVAILCFMAVKTGNKRELWLSLSRGGFLLVGIIVIFLAYLMVNFDSLFTQFHNLFFESGTWLFYYTDTFIRLFPLTFWQDAFIMTFLLSFSGGALLGFLARRRAIRTF